MITLCFNFLLLAYTSVFFVLTRKTMKGSVTGLLGLLFVITLMSVGLSPDGLGAVALMAWGVFLHVPLFLLTFSVLASRAHKHRALMALLIALLILTLCADAFLIEPHWLEVAHVTLTSEKLDRSIRVAVLADIQTDAPGEYDARVFARVKAEKPDLILFLGDYIQTTADKFAPCAKKLNTLLHDADFNPPLGQYAIRGNKDHDTWTDIFSDLNVTCLDQTTTTDIGPMILTGLSFAQSFQTNVTLEPQEKFHLVLGHGPDYALGQTHADLMLAGHTHGGQVRIPGLGPLLTYSKVPRAWASGLTQITPNQHLYVSRGIGMERGHAPRLRFLCRPELLIMTLAPAP
ncbi:MAG: metallophosphoesterase family protein [Phycisphaeraceae bacterium]|nr:metallophosphoesterase family protein [Phycisphaeraceae bacterium]